MVKILITGGAGFIGSNLASYIISQKSDVFVIDNFITSNKSNIEHLKKNAAFHFIKGDITDNNTFNTLLSYRFDHIFHLASAASPIQYSKYAIETLMTNSVGTKNVLDFMVKTKSKRFVYASTSEVYGDPLVHPQPEKYWGNVNSIGERSCYDEAKRFGEALCMSYMRKKNLDIRIVRIFNTYGPFMEKDDGRVISNFVNQALDHKKITVYGKGTQTRSFCYIDDLVLGLNKMMNTPNLMGEVINLGNDNEITIIEIAHLIKKLTKSKSEVVYNPLPQDDPKKRKPDLTKAEKLLNWKPTVELKTGIINTINYFAGKN